MCELLYIIETRSPGRSRLHGRKTREREDRRKFETLVDSRDIINQQHYFLADVWKYNTSIYGYL